MGRGPLLTVCPRPLTLASSLRMGPRGQKVLLRYACKKELDMHVYSQGAAADGEVAADDARAGSGGGGARARPSCTLEQSRKILRRRRSIKCTRRASGPALRAGHCLEQENWLSGHRLALRGRRGKGERGAKGWKLIKNFDFTPKLLPQHKWSYVGTNL